MLLKFATKKQQNIVQVVKQYITVVEHARNRTGNTTKTNVKKEMILKQYGTV